MQRIIILYFLFLLSCKSVNQVSSITEYIVIDLRRYTEQDFLITTEKFNENYEAIGLLELSVFPGATRLRNGQTLPENTYKQGFWAVEKLSTEEAIDEIYNRAKEMGADAIMNFELTTVKKTIAIDLQLSGFKMKGFAIKRE